MVVYLVMLPGVLKVARSVFVPTRVTLTSACGNTAAMSAYSTKSCWSFWPVVLAHHDCHVLSCVCVAELK
jgi:hypothetical protein